MAAARSGDADVQESALAQMDKDSRQKILGAFTRDLRAHGEKNRKLRFDCGQPGAADVRH